MGRWLLLLIPLYIASVLLTAMSGKTDGEVAWGFILGAMMYGFVYSVALIPVILLVLNKERKSTILYLLNLIICGGCMLVAIIFSSGMDGSFSIFLSLFTPFLCIFAKTIYDWYMGYESKHWDQF